MHSDTFSILLKYVYIFISIVNLSYTEYVPVLIWDSAEISQTVPALEPIKQDVFQNLLVERVGKNVPVLIFAEENLSMEDFALYDSEGKSPFAKISSLQSHDEVGYFPFVKNPMFVVQNLPERNLIKMSIGEVLNGKLSLRNDDVLIVNLNDAEENEGRLEMLKRHDDSVSKIHANFLKQNKNLVTLFTGYHTSWVTSEELYKHRQTRDAETPNVTVYVEEDDKLHGLLYKNNHVLLWVNHTPTINTSASQSYTFDSFNFTDNSPTNDHSMNVTLTSLADAGISLEFNVEYDMSYWYLTSVQFRNGTGSNKTLIKIRDVYAPLNQSYHCNITNFQTTKLKENQDVVTLSMIGFQFQPFINETIKNITFGEAYDCVPFMTVPILSGIFVTLILVLIMSFGLTIIMEIKTMDRFDDPKGKTITISAAE